MVGLLVTIRDEQARAAHSFLAAFEVGLLGNYRPRVFAAFRIDLGMQS